MARLTYSNPIAPDTVQLRDPMMLRHLGGWYLYGTTPHGSRPPDDGFDAFYSRDLVHWSAAGQVYAPDESAWHQSGLAAPQVYPINGRFYMFYTARTAPDRHGVGLAGAPSPLGPFTDGPTNPLTPQDMDCRDGHLFTDAGGTHWLFFVQDWRQKGQHGRLFLQRLSSDLMRTDGEPIMLLTGSDLPWAQPITEADQTGRPLQAPAMLCRDGRFYLMCTTHGESGACVGCLVADQLTGPYRPQGLVLRHDAGHNWVFIGPDGKSMYTAYHSPDRPAADSRLCIDELRILQDGTLWIDESRDQPRTIQTT
jgi:beta-xylosidase